MIQTPNKYHKLYDSNRPLESHHWCYGVINYFETKMMLMTSPEVLWREDISFLWRGINTFISRFQMEKKNQNTKWIKLHHIVSFTWLTTCALMLCVVTAVTFLIKISLMCIHKVSEFWNMWSRVKCHFSDIQPFKNYLLIVYVVFNEKTSFVIPTWWDNLNGYREIAKSCSFLFLTA